MKKIKLLIKGMHCASCASNIERSLKKIPGVNSCSVNVLTRKGIVECSDEVSDDELRKAVKKTGYEVVALEKE